MLFFLDDNDDSRDCSREGERQVHRRLRVLEEMLQVKHENLLCHTLYQRKVRRSTATEHLMIHSLSDKHKKGRNRGTICVMGHNTFKFLPHSAEATSSMGLAASAKLLCIVYYAAQSHQGYKYFVT